MLRLVLFDIDGTLIRTGGAGVHAFERTGATEFHVPDGMREMQFAGRTDTSLVREFFERHGIAATPENFRRFFDRYVLWLDHLLPRHSGAVCPGVRELLTGLRALPHPPLLGLQTGNIRLGAEIKLRHFGLWGWFAVGGFGDDDENRHELTRRAVERAVRRLGQPLAPREVLVVGDTPHDIDCARAVGARVLAVATGGATRAQLAARAPDWLVDDLTQIDAATLAGCR
jgi:phosphoglycolate phosphatase-like HAD superfamily hydrolase